jgi:hypothetical protein
LDLVNRSWTGSSFGFMPFTAELRPGVQNITLYQALQTWIYSEVAIRMESGEELFLPEKDTVDKAGSLAPLALALRLRRDTWRKKLRLLHLRIADFESEDFGNPDDTTISRAQRLRLGLVEIRTSLKRFKDLPLPKANEIDHNPIYLINSGEIHELYDEANALSERLHDDMQLVTGGITLRESKETKGQAEQSRRQAGRATLLTVLAAIYLPLSIVTGIFGMNLNNINGSSSTWRDPIYTVILLLSLTPVPVGYIMLKGSSASHQVQNTLRSLGPRRTDGDDKGGGKVHGGSILGRKGFRGNEVDISEVAETGGVPRADISSVEQDRRGAAANCGPLAEKGRRSRRRLGRLLQRSPHFEISDPSGIA